MCLKPLRAFISVITYTLYSVCFFNGDKFVCSFMNHLKLPQISRTYLKIFGRLTSIITRTEVVHKNVIKGNNKVKLMK